MKRAAPSIIFLFLNSALFAQHDLLKRIEDIQFDKFLDEQCLDFIRTGDIKMDKQDTLLQIIIVRHGEPAFNKRGWKNRDEAVEYIKMYDSVDVYSFDQKPICFREDDPNIVFTSLLPRAINTAEKTFGNEYPVESKPLFNEFERKVIDFPNIKLPGKFWFITSRFIWTLGFNHKGIESFSEARDRSREAAIFLDQNTQKHKMTVLFSHGFLNKYIKKQLKKSGYKVIDMNGQKYLGAYYFYKVK